MCVWVYVSQLNLCESWKSSLCACVRPSVCVVPWWAPRARVHRFKCVCDSGMQLAAQLDRGGYGWSWIDWLASSSSAAGNTNMTHKHTDTHTYWPPNLCKDRAAHKKRNKQKKPCGHTNSRSCRGNTSPQQLSITIQTVWMHAERCQNHLQTCMHTFPLKHRVRLHENPHTQRSLKRKKLAWGFCPIPVRATRY